MSNSQLPLFSADEISNAIEKALNEGNTNSPTYTWEQDEYYRAPPKQKARPVCVECYRDLSVTLDAYYGRDSRGSTHCEPCRRKLKIP